MQVCKNLILALASFSTASRLWTPPTRPEQPKRPDSGRSDTGQSHHTVQNTPSVQTLDALIPARVQQESSFFLIRIKFGIKNRIF
jgi:hypothetical protein